MQDSTKASNPGQKAKSPWNNKPDEHPFLAWWAGLKRLDAISLEGKDFILSDVAAKRFAVGVHGGFPLLCWLEQDRQALESMAWTSAALAFGLKGRDWIALSATDVRIKGAASLNPVPARLFVPVSTGRLDAWKDVTPAKLAVGSMADGSKPAFAGTPFKTLPLKLLAR